MQTQDSGSGKMRVVKTKASSSGHEFAKSAMEKINQLNKMLAHANDQPHRHINDSESSLAAGIEGEATMQLIFREIIGCAHDVVNSWTRTKMSPWALSSLESRTQHLLKLIDTAAEHCEIPWPHGIVLERSLRNHKTWKKRIYHIQFGNIYTRSTREAVDDSEPPIDSVLQLHPEITNIYSSSKRPGVLLQRANSISNSKTGSPTVFGPKEGIATSSTQRHRRSPTSIIKSWVPSEEEKTLSQFQTRSVKEAHRILQQLKTEQLRLQVEDFIRKLPLDDQEKISLWLRNASQQQLGLQYLFLPASFTTIRSSITSNQNHGSQISINGLSFTIRFSLKSRRTLDLCFQNKKRLVLYDTAKKYARCLVEPVAVLISPNEFMGWTPNFSKKEIEIRHAEMKDTLQGLIGTSMVTQKLGFTTEKDFHRANQLLSWFGYQDPEEYIYSPLVQRLTLNAVGLLPYESSQIERILPCAHRVFSALRGCLTSGKLLFGNKYVDGLFEESTKSFREFPAQSKEGNAYRFKSLLICLTKACSTFKNKSKAATTQDHTRESPAIFIKLLVFISPLFLPFLVPSGSVNAEVSFWVLKCLYFICSFQSQASDLCKLPQDVPKFQIGGVVMLPFEYYVSKMLKGAEIYEKRNQSIRKRRGSFVSTPFLQRFIDVLWELMSADISTEYATKPDEEMFKTIRDSSIFPLMLSVLSASPPEVEVYGLQKLLTAVKTPDNFTMITSLKDWQISLYALLSKTKDEPNLHEAKVFSNRQRNWSDIIEGKTETKSLSEIASPRQSSSSEAELKCVRFLVSIMTDIHLQDMLNNVYKKPTLMEAWRSVHLLRNFSPWSIETRSGARMLLTSLAVSLVSNKHKVSRIKGSDSPIHRNFFFFLLLVGEFVTDMWSISPLAIGDDEIETLHILANTQSTTEARFDINDIGLLDAAVNASKTLKLHETESSKAPRGPLKKILDIENIFTSLRDCFKKQPNGGVWNEPTKEIRALASSFERIASKHLRTGEVEAVAQSGNGTGNEGNSKDNQKSVVWIGVADISNSVRRVGSMRGSHLAIDFVRSRRNTTMEKSRAAGSSSTSRHLKSFSISATYNSRRERLASNSSLVPTPPSPPPSPPPMDDNHTNEQNDKKKGSKDVKHNTGTSSKIPALDLNKVKSKGRPTIALGDSSVVLRHERKHCSDSDEDDDTAVGNEPMEDAKNKSILKSRDKTLRKERELIRKQLKDEMQSIIKDHDKVLLYAEELACSKKKVEEEYARYKAENARLKREIKSLRNHQKTTLMKVADARRIRDEVRQEEREAQHKRVVSAFKKKNEMLQKCVEALNRKLSITTSKINSLNDEVKKSRIAVKTEAARAQMALEEIARVRAERDEAEKERILSEKALYAAQLEVERARDTTIEAKANHSRSVSPVSNSRSRDKSSYSSLVGNFQRRQTEQFIRTESFDERVSTPEEQNNLRLKNMVVGQHTWQCKTQGQVINDVWVLGEKGDVSGVGAQGAVSRPGEVTRTIKGIWNPRNRRIRFEVIRGGNKKEAEIQDGRLVLNKGGVPIAVVKGSEGKAILYNMVPEQQNQFAAAPRLRTQSERPISKEGRRSPSSSRSPRTRAISPKKIQRPQITTMPVKQSEKKASAAVVTSFANADVNPPPNNNSQHESDARAAVPEQQSIKGRPRSYKEGLRVLDMDALHRIERAIPSISEKNLQNDPLHPSDVKLVVGTLREVNIFTERIAIKEGMIKALIKRYPSASDASLSILCLEGSNVRCKSWDIFLEEIGGKVVCNFKHKVFGLLDAVLNDKASNKLLREVISLSVRCGGPSVVVGILHAIKESSKMLGVDQICHEIQAKFKDGMLNLADEEKLTTAALKSYSSLLFSTQTEIRLFKSHVISLTKACLFSAFGFSEYGQKIREAKSGITQEVLAKFMKCKKTFVSLDSLILEARKIANA